MEALECMFCGDGEWTRLDAHTFVISPIPHNFELQVSLPSHYPAEAAATSLECAGLTRSALETVAAAVAGTADRLRGSEAVLEMVETARDAVAAAMAAAASEAQRPPAPAQREHAVVRIAHMNCDLPPPLHCKWPELTLSVGTQRPRGTRAS